MTVKAIMIDLDGTLVDSAPDITEALNYSLGQMGYHPFKLSQTRQWIGNGLDALLHRALTNDFDGKADLELLQKAKTGFYQAYHQTNGQQASVYPGVMTALKRFQSLGCTLICITNKNREFTLPLLERLQLIDYFDLVIAGDDVSQKKPHPEALEKVLETYKLSPDECIMVGDSDNDVTAGNRASVPVCCVNYGYSQGIDLNQLDIVSMVASIGDIPLEIQITESQ